MTRAGRILAVALLAAGCNQGNELTDPLDLAQPSADGSASSMDLAAPPDLPAGKSCGQIVSCVLQCGTANAATCDPMCFQGADPQALLQAGALVACAAQNCLQLGDGGLAGGLGGLGGGGTAGIFQCLISNCQSQIGACPGLFPTPM